MKGCVVTDIEPGTDEAAGALPPSLEGLRRQMAQLRAQIRESATFEQGGWGVDGHTFAFEVALSRPLPVGGYVTLTTRDGRRYLGQIIEQQIVDRDGPALSVDLGAVLGEGSTVGTGSVTVRVRLASGSGVLLAGLTDEGFVRTERRATFDLAEIAEAPGALVDDFITWSLGGGAGLDTGAASFGSGEVLPLLAAKGFNRHTFLCGQSGSGKTYGLGVLLERLLLHTTIGMVILDPNSDYVGLADLLPRDESGARGEAYDRVAAHWGDLRRRVVVLGPGDEAMPFKVVFGRLTQTQQALVLGLDPIRDAGHFAAFRTLRDAADSTQLTLSRLLAYAEDAEDPTLRALATRIRNIGAPTWDVWAGEGDTPVLDALPHDARVLVADLGRTESPKERSVQSAAVLEWLWSRRHERIPRLVVIDEAHNVCPQQPQDPMQALATEHVVRIAAEGRKYGLYLLLSTQQPQKIHANVLAQCDNLILLRMNSSIDVDHLAQVFGFVPATLLQQAQAFRLGEGLVAGRISPHPLRYTGARRWTREGGADVPTTWAQPPG
jgi:hypothetical protein